MKSLTLLKLISMYFSILLSDMMQLKEISHTIPKSTCSQNIAQTELINFLSLALNLFIWGFTSLSTLYRSFSRRVVGRAEETSTYSSLGFCTVNCRPTASNYLLSHLRPCRESNPSLRGGRQECYHSATVAPVIGT